MKKAALILLGAAGALAAASWTHAAAAAGFHDKPASPRSLPADNLPPFGMLDDNGNLVAEPPLPPGGINRGPGTPPETTARGPSLALAIEAARAAIAGGRAAGFRVGVAVVDSLGEARAMLTADDADGSHGFVAMRKALTALAYQMPSSTAHERVPQGAARPLRPAYSKCMSACGRPNR